MKCREARKLLRPGIRQESEGRKDAILHAEGCEECRQTILLDSLSRALLEAHGSRHDAKQEIPENIYLMTRIKARIRELSEQGMGSWESAVLALRGWVFAIGAAALLLLAISFQWQLSKTATPLDHDNDVTSLPNISEDFLGDNLNAPTNPINEAASNAHK